MRKVLVPIYLKLVSFILLLMLISLSLYVYYAVDLFKNDKISYVFESVDDFNEKIFNQVNQSSKNYLNQLNQIAMMNFNSDLIYGFLNQYSDVDRFLQIQNNKVERIISLKNNNQQLDLKSLNFDPSRNLFVNQDKIYFYLTLKNNKTIAYELSKNIFLKDFSSQLYQNFFITHQPENDSFKKSLIAEVKSRGASAQTFLYDAAEKFIVSSRDFNSLFYIISLTEYSKAIAASASLQSNSIYFGVLVAGFIMLLVLLFSQVVSKPINHLTNVVNDFFDTNFNSRSHVSTRDEIGFLSESFNKMADDINNYMEEVKIKAQMENELKTAQLVQSQFFPNQKFENDFCQVAGFYQSATECGGDWWGVYDLKGFTTVILADVTGHGTPAALMTAVLHNCLNSLNQLAQFDKDYYSNSAKIMEFLNKSFALSTNQLNATAFVICLEHKTGNINYANASHNPPFLLKLSEGVVDKSSIIPLIESQGIRLGQQNETEYKSSALQLKSKDKIIFYTDGVLEGENSEQKAYGQRRFVKSMLGSQDLEVTKLCQNITQDFFDFKQGVLLEDDLTIVAFEYAVKSYYLSSNINNSEKEHLSINVSEDKNCPRWIYKGSLVDNLSDIPDEISSLVSLKSFGSQYLSSHVLASKNKVSSLKFSNESSSGVHDALLNEINKFDYTKTFDDLGRYLLIVGVELVRNAIIIGEKKGAVKDVNFEIYEDKENYYIKVKDHYGLLTSQMVTSRLKEVAKTGEYERKNSGAGLGLFMVVCSVNTIVFDVCKDQSTSIYTRINKYKRLKHFKEKQTAIFFNIKD